MKKWNVDIKFDSGWFGSVKRYLALPFPMFFLGIIATYTFEWIREEVNTPYYDYKTETISDRKYLTKIKIGNSGQKELSFFSIINKPSIVLTSRQFIKIDSAKTIEISRPELKSSIKTKVIDNEIVNIDLLDEAFEKDDYIIIGIFHEHLQPTEWKIKTRIIGNLDGFTNYNKLFKNTSIPNTILYLIVVIIFSIGIRYYVFKRRSEVFILRLWELIFLVMLICLTLFYIYVYFKVSKYLL